MKKILEETAKSTNPYSKYNGEWMQGYLSGMYEEGFNAGAKFGYKEAIKDMVQYLQRDYAYNASMAIHDEAFITDFEKYMNKLWEE